VIATRPPARWLPQDKHDEGIHLGGMKGKSGSRTVAPLCAAKKKGWLAQSATLRFGETVNRRAVLALRQPAELALRAPCVIFFDDGRE